MLGSQVCPIIPDSRGAGDGTQGVLPTVFPVVHVHKINTPGEENSERPLEPFPSLRLTQGSLFHRS